MQFLSLIHISKKTTISADVVAKLVKEAGTSDITITQTTKNASGKEMNSVSVNAKDLQAGKKLTLVKVDKKTGEKVLISSLSLIHIYPTVYFYALVDGEEVKADGKLQGYVNWYTVVIPGITPTDGAITVGAHVATAPGGWGTIDDITLVKE